MATLQIAPSRARGRGRGSLSYLSLQQSLEKTPSSSTSPNTEITAPEKNQFDDAPGAYLPRSQSPVGQQSSPKLPHVPPASFTTPPPTTFSTPPPQSPPPATFATPPPPATFATPPPPATFATPPPPTPPPVPPSVDVVVKNSATNKSSPEELFEQLKLYLPDGAEEVARSIHSTCIVDREFSEKAAKCCQDLTLHEAGGSEFRSFLLRSLQSDFKNRATIFEKSESDFLSCVSLLCQVFAVMRDRSGLPLLPLATPVVEYLSMMLQDFSLTNNASKVLAQNLQLVGPILSEKAPEKEQALIETVRQKILDEKTESLTRCQLLQILEWSLSSWKALPAAVSNFYQSNLNNLLRDA